MESNMETYTNSIFEEEWWLDIVAPGQWKEVIVKEGQKVVGRLVFVLNKNNKKIYMPPYTQTLGYWIKPEYRTFKQGNSQLSKQRAIINSLLEQLPNVKNISMTFDSINEYILPFRWKGYRFEPYFSYRLNNLSDLDGVYQNFHKNIKKSIEKSAEELEIVDSKDYKDMYELLKSTFQVQNRKVPYSEELIKEIIEKSIEKGAGKLFVAVDKQNNKHSAAFLLYDKRVCYYLIGGSDSKFRNSGAQSLVLWKSIRFASTVSEKFDFEGSMVEGIEYFFRQFGGERVTNYRVIKQGILTEIKELIKPKIKIILGYKI